MRTKTSSTHIAALDGIRGVAAILVFVSHAASASAAVNPLAAAQTPFGAREIAMRGWVGVDLFFILSGYLITGILLHAKDVENYYQVFYARRALRILPLYYLVMFVSILLSQHRPTIQTQVWFWFNLSNLLTAFNPGIVTYLGHYWTLAIEEQFYLIWPAVIRRVKQRWLMCICFGAIVGCLILRNLPIVLTWNHRWTNFVYRLTPFRIDTLCAGALLAIMVHRGANLSKFRAHLRVACIVGAIVLTISLFARTSIDLPARLGYTGGIVCFTALIALALEPTSLTGKIFGNRFLRRMGLYSYCFYLVHVGVLSHDSIFTSWLARLHLAFATEELNQLVAHCFAFAVTFGICAASYKFFESPILDLKRLFPYRQQRIREWVLATAG